MPEKKKRQKSRLTVKTCALLLGLCLTLGLSAGIASAEEESSKNQLENGSFENGPHFDKSYDQPDQGDVPAWNTTAFQGKIELFRENTGTYLTGVKLKPTDGTYAAELNADEESTLYQIVSTTKSSVYEWGLDHGARNGTDIIALVIGPKQSYNPYKPSKDGRDQFMQMVDWLDIDINTITAGTEPKQFTVYSKKFAESGTFADNVGNNAFSLTPSTIYTEEWHIWIMSSKCATAGQTENPWNSYGSNAEGSAGSGDGFGGTDVDLNKYYLYTVPEGQTETLFGFVSVGYKDSTAGSDAKAKTYGNFLDNINFTLYHPLYGSTTTHGSAVIGGSDGTTEGEGATKGHEVTVGNDLITYVTDGSMLKIQAIVKKNDSDAGCEFVGLYYTTLDGSGMPVANFLQLSGNEIEYREDLTDAEKARKWIKSTNEDHDIVYTYYLTGLTTPTDLHFVFIKNPTITYDPNGGKPYVVERTYNTEEAVNVYSYKPAVSGEGAYTFISPYVSHAAEGQNDGWKFMGWLLTGDTVGSSLPETDKVNADKLGNLLLPAEHTVACDYTIGASGAAQFFKIYNDNAALTGTQITEDSVVKGVKWTDGGADKAYANVHKGLTMVAQWRWRQAFIPQVGSGSTYTDSDSGGTVEITSVTVPSDNYIAAYNGYGGKAYFAEANETVTVRAAAKEGYTFLGWYDEDGNLITTSADYTYTVTRESVNTCYTRFSGNVTQTYVRQYWNGSAWVETANDDIGTLDRYSYTDAVGTLSSSTATAGSGYCFAGWYDSENKPVCGSTTFSYITTGDATYYARFTTKQTVMIEVIGNSDSKVYNGAEYSVSGYTVKYTLNGTELSSCPAYIAFHPKDIAVTNAAANGTAAGDYTMTLSADDFNVSATGDYSCELFVYPGKLTINPRPITITADSASKVYDSEALTKNSYTYTQGTASDEEGLVAGQSITAAVTGSQTEIGVSDNVVSSAVIKDNETDVTGNYDISYVKGTLEVTKAEGAPDVYQIFARYKAGTNGSLTGETYQAFDLRQPPSIELKTSVELTFPTPNADGGYHFTGWTNSDGVTVTGSVMSGFTPGATYTFTAQFTRNYTPPSADPDPKPNPNPDPAEESDSPITVKGLNTVDHMAYIIGIGDDRVNPLGTITRAEIANIFFRLMTDDFRNANWSTDNRFNDVPNNAWYSMAVLNLDKAGIITDSDEGNFRPTDPITRAELAVMAAQFCTITEKVPATSFKDIPADYWAADEIALIEYAGWIEGYNGCFHPDDNLSRAEAMTIVNRMLHRGAEKEHMLDGMTTWVDNADSSQWYYNAVQEATNSHDYTRTNVLLTGEQFHGDKWTELLEATDWAAMERAWINANS